MFAYCFILMGVSLDIYRAAIGLFCFFKLLYAKTCLFTVSFASLCLHLGALLASFFLICLDVHMNPGPEHPTSLKVGPGSDVVLLPCRT